MLFLSEGLKPPLNEFSIFNSIHRSDGFLFQLLCVIQIGAKVLSACLTENENTCLCLPSE